MTLTIDLPDDVAAAIKSQAAARGLSVEDWLQELATRQLQSARTSEDAIKPRRRISEVIAEIVADAPPEELAKLPKDGASQVDHYVYGLPPGDSENEREKQQAWQRFVQTTAVSIDDPTFKRHVQGQLAKDDDHSS